VCEDLDDVPEGDSSECCKDEGILAESLQRAGHYNPPLKYTPLTFSEPATGNKPAAHSLEQDVHNAVPEIRLNSLDENAEEKVWLPQADLLSSQANDLHFVAELDNEGAPIYVLVTGNWVETP